MSTAAERFAALPTAAKLLLILTAVLLPIGIALVWVAGAGIRDADHASREITEDQARAAARAIESLIARNVLALRIATNGALVAGPTGACDRAQRSLAVAPGVAHGFEINTADGRPLCKVGDVPTPPNLPIVAPGAIRLRASPTYDSLILRVGVVGGMATTAIPAVELRSAAVERNSNIESLAIRDGVRELRLIQGGGATEEGRGHAYSEWPLGNRQLLARIGARVPLVTTGDRLMLLLPLVMWVLAALITWLLVTRLLIRPLRRQSPACSPGRAPMSCPTNWARRPRSRSFATPSPAG